VHCIPAVPRVRFLINFDQELIAFQKFDVTLNFFENICFQIDAQRLYHHAFLGYVHRIASPGLLCFHAVDEFACLPYHAMRINSSQRKIINVRN
jgi:hypothetical protein